MNQIPAIPTQYKGVQFRSRLEAKWAAFFDLLGWKWEYEPIDLSGYIPDFMLLTTTSPIFVEVKPCTTLQEFETDPSALPRALKAFSAQKEKYERTELLLVGATLPKGDSSIEEYVGLGWLGDAIQNEPGFTIPLNEVVPVHGGFEHAVLIQNSVGFDFFHRELSWHGRIRNEHSGDEIWRDVASEISIQSLWAKAGNAVQWRAPKTSKISSQIPEKTSASGTKRETRVQPPLQPPNDWGYILVALAGLTSHDFVGLQEDMSEDDFLHLKDIRYQFETLQINYDPWSRLDSQEMLRKHRAVIMRAQDFRKAMEHEDK